MKALKVFAIAVIAMFTFQGAKAQVAISAHIGTPAPVYHHPRTVVVTRPVYHRPVRRTVVYHRPVYRRPVHRTVYVNRGYHHPKRVVVVRH